MTSAWARAPLRVKLVTAVVALVSLALAATGFAATAALRGYLLHRVDAQLRQAAGPIVTRVERGVPVPGPLGRARIDLPSSFYLQLTDANGRPVGTLAAPLDAEQSPPALPLLDAGTVADRANDPFTVPSTAGGARWRVMVIPLAAGSGSLTLGLSLDQVSATLARLALVDVVVSVVVLAGLAWLGHALVRSSLRPLAEVEQTAAAIAAGDLSRRVPYDHPGTEVGRLSRALNGMLAQIETAFRARQHSEAAARASEERMRRFVADASHELRTPLTSIRGFAELARQHSPADPEYLAGALRRIEDESTRMALLVDDLLLLARLDQQRPLQRRPVDLLALAADAVAAARALAPDRSITLDVHTRGGAPPIVAGDEPRLRQVLANLLANAVNHTPAAPVTVTVASSPAGSVRLEVADRGPGLTAPEAARVFERFYRGDPARSRSPAGSGLGLSIVAALVAAHGGTVDLDTAPGQGAAFRITLPLLAEPESAPLQGPARPGAEVTA